MKHIKTLILLSFLILVVEFIRYNEKIQDFDSQFLSNTQALAFYLASSLENNDVATLHNFVKVFLEDGIKCIVILESDTALPKFSRGPSECLEKMISDKAIVQVPVEVNGASQYTITYIKKRSYFIQQLLENDWVFLLPIIILVLVIIFIIRREKQQTLLRIKRLIVLFEESLLKRDGAVALSHENRESDAFIQYVSEKLQRYIQQFKSLHSEIASLEKQKSLFSLASSIAHDMRSPIAVLEASLSEEKINESLVRQAANRLKTIADGLLGERKKQSRERVDTSLNDLLINLIREKSVEHPYHKIKTVLKEDYRVIGEVTGLERAISNFINNAAEASPQNSEIVFTQENGKIVIQDQGCGLTKEQLEKMGKAPVRTTKEHGNGLGVYSSVQAIAELGGTINFESIERVGTTVTINLNANATNNTTENIQRVNSIQTTSQHIVLIDDDGLIRMVWEARAKKRGENLKTYAQVNDLMKEIEIYPLDTIFYIDVNIGSESGVDLARLLYERGYRELILATGEDAEKFSELGFIKKVVGKNGE